MIKKPTIFLITLFLHLHISQAQTYNTLKGYVEFSSVAEEELINATNNSVASQLISSTGKGQFIIPIKSFRFKKPLLQEHFNENYLESDTYPKSTYKYSISAVEKINFGKKGRYPVETVGVMTIKNTAKNLRIQGFITVVDDKTIRLEADFLIVPSDYGIAIPKVVEYKIAKQIHIKVNTLLTKPN